MNSISAKAPRKNGLQAESADYVASLLLASLIVVSPISLVLFLYWLLQSQIGPEPDKELFIGGVIEGRDHRTAEVKRDIEPPPADDVELLAQNSSEATLKMVSASASEVALERSSMGAGSGEVRRLPGPLGAGEGEVPRHQRWEIKFRANGLESYAQQLDFFNIELACVGGSSTLDYVSDVSTSPKKRIGTPQEENERQRLYFIWRSSGPLKQYDAQLLSQAGVVSRGRLILRFIPKDLESQLASAESSYARSQGYQSVQSVAKTIFETRQLDQGFEFVVIEQHYRNSHDNSVN